MGRCPGSGRVHGAEDILVVICRECGVYIHSLHITQGRKAEGEQCVYVSDALLTLTRVSLGNNPRRYTKNDCLS